MEMWNNAIKRDDKIKYILEKLMLTIDNIK